MRYVALGDSYTIGIGVKPRDRWPNQLVRVLRPAIALDVTANLALNGNTTIDVIHRQLPQLDELDPQFVSLLIGVNDVIQNVSETTYRANVGIILDAMLKRVPADRVLTVATPDYTLTPHGGDFVATRPIPARRSPGRARPSHVSTTSCDRRPSPATSPSWISAPSAVACPRTPPCWPRTSCIRRASSTPVGSS